MITALGCDASSSRTALPPKFLGRWYHTGSSGGITGEVMGDATAGFIVINAKNTIDHHDEDGRVVSSTIFTPSRGRTIFSTEDQWILTSLHDLPQVMMMSDDGLTLTLSDDAYDGITRTYGRSPATPPVERIHDEP
jgi:hypothetical protein